MSPMLFEVFYCRYTLRTEITSGFHHEMEPMVVDKVREMVRYYYLLRGYEGGVELFRINPNKASDIADLLDDETRKGRPK